MCLKKKPNLMLASLLFVFPVIAAVTETAQDYICTGQMHRVESKLAMKNPNCDHYWSAGDHSIGTLLGSIPECHRPCEELTAGHIVLMECVNITLAVICTEAGGTIESRVHFYGKMLPRSLHRPENKSHIGAFLAVALTLIVCLLCVGLSLKQCLRYRSMQSNTGT